MSTAIYIGRNHPELNYGQTGEATLTGPYVWLFSPHGTGEYYWTITDDLYASRFVTKGEE